MLDTLFDVICIRTKSGANGATFQSKTLHKLYDFFTQILH